MKTEPNNENSAEKAEILVFDLDGTIIDDTSSGFDKIRFILSELGLPEISEEILRQNWGKKMADVFDTVAKEVGASAEQRLKFEELEKKFPMNYSFDPQLGKTMEQLRNSGYIIGIVTSRDEKSLKTLATEVQLNLDLFHYIQTKENSLFHKPDGRVFQPLIGWLENSGLCNGSIIYFGDTLTDLRATQSCGFNIKFVGVVSGATKASEFFKNDVTDIVDLKIIPEYPSGVGSLTGYLKTNFFNRDALESEIVN